MSARICTISILADEIRTTYGSSDSIVIGNEVFIHEVTPELARQWIGVLETIAKEETK